MTRKLATLATSAAFAGALGLAGLAASTTAASAHYTTTRCYGAHCRVVRCDDDGDYCRTIRAYWRDRPYEHRRWACDWDGDRCHRVYDRRYYRWHDRPHVGISFGWHD